jgi:hypothetical protein
MGDPLDASVGDLKVYQRPPKFIHSKYLQFLLDTPKDSKQPLPKDEFALTFTCSVAIESHSETVQPAWVRQQRWDRGESNNTKAAHTLCFAPHIQT